MPSSASPCARISSTTRKTRSDSSHVITRASSIQLMAATMIPGLHSAPRYSDLARSAEVYNELPYDHEQPPISEKTLDDLCQLFRRHHAHHLFGIHLIHRHFQTSDNHVMLGSKMNGNLWWTKPTSISAVDMSSLHGHIYVVSLDRGLFPYEYREGSSPKQVSQVDSTFYQELAEYLIQQQLHNVLGLEVLENFQGAGKRMLEIVIQDHSTIMMEEEYASSLETLKITGWMISQDTDGILSLRGNEGHSRPRGGQHVIFTDGKLLQTNEDMMAFLEARGIKSSLVSEK